jgi:hypothetical protein
VVYKGRVSLHGNPIFETARLPDGREARIRVGVAEDPYIADRDSNTVVLEVRLGRVVAAVLDTILDPLQVSEASHLAARVRDGLSSGTLEPTANSLEPLTDEIL